MWNDVNQAMQQNIAKFTQKSGLLPLHVTATVSLITSVNDWRKAKLEMRVGEENGNRRDQKTMIKIEATAHWKALWQ